MKNQALFATKDKSKKLKGRLLQFLFGTLRAEISKSKKPNPNLYFYYLSLPLPR